MVKMKPGLYYFAHPYSAKTEEGRTANFELACRRSAILLLKGYNIFSPIVHSHPIEMANPELLSWPQEKLWQFWLDIDLAILEFVNFTGIILAPLWGTSKGCKKEYEWFLGHVRSDGKPYDILRYNDLIGN
jgi:hypothetical protein